MKNTNFNYFLVIIGLNGALGNLVGYFLPIYFKELGFSGIQIGLYFGITSVAMIVLSLPMGVSTDRIKIWLVIAGSFFLIGISKFGFVISQSFVVFCIFSFIGSFGGRFFSTAITSLFFKITGSDNPHASGLYQLVQFLSMGAGMIGGALLIARLNFHAMFVIGFIMNWVLMIMALFLPRNEQIVVSIQEYKKEVFKPSVLFIALIFSLSSIHNGAESISYAPFLKTVLHLSTTQIGLFTGSGFWFVGIGAYLGVILLKKKIIPDLQVLLMIGFLLSGVFHIAMTVDNLWWSFGFRLLHEIGDGMVFLGYYHGIATIFNIDRIGGCAAFISLWTSLASFIASTVYGVTAEKYGHSSSLISSGIVMIIIPVLILFRREKVMHAEHSPAPENQGQLTTEKVSQTV